MSVLAGGSVEMTMKSEAPEEIIKQVEEEFGDIIRHDLQYTIEFEGNWWMEDVIDNLEPLNPYIESGHISYWSDEGDAVAEFNYGMWREEWEEKYYASDLPNPEVSNTSRVSEILNTIANDLMAYSDSSEAIRILFDECKLTDKEIKYYNLSWLKDLKGDDPDEKEPIREVKTA